jgi:hypothetical protein
MGSKVISRGHIDRQTGDLISLLAFLKSTLKVGSKVISGGKIDGETGELKSLLSCFKSRLTSGSKVISGGHRQDGQTHWLFDKPTFISGN